MTCSLALRNPRLFAPEYPDALSSTARRCFLPWTERFTLAIVTASCVRGDRLAPRFGYRPSRRSTCLRSPPVTSAPRPRRRVRRLDFFSSRCERNAFRRRIFPEPLTWYPLAALPPGPFPSSASRLPFAAVPAGLHRPGASRALGRVQHHRHVAAVLAGRRFDHGDVTHLLGHALQDP